MLMSGENVQKSEDNDISLNSVSDQQPNTSPPSSPASSTSSLERSNSTDGGPLLGTGIIEVSDDKEDADDAEDDVHIHRSHMPFRRPHAHMFLMTCGHPAPPLDRNRIKKWAAHGRSWCQTCNPLTTPNLIRGSNQLSGWRKTMEQLIEKKVFPLPVLNLNDTYVYVGNNGQDANLMSTNANSPPFMLDLDVFLGIVCANDLCRLPLRALSSLRSFIHTDTRVLSFFEKIHPQSLCHFSTNLLETAIRLMDDPSEQSEIAFRRSKAALQCFYQTAVRVPFFRETIYKHQLSQWLNLLRIEFLRNEIILSILMVIREMHSWFHADDLYIRLLSDMLLLFSSPTVASENRSFITTIFTVLFNTDPSFLYECCRLMDRESFVELLGILETALNVVVPIFKLRDFEFNVPPKSCLHPLNLSFCLELIEQIDRELAEFRALKFDISTRLTLLTSIISTCASVRDYYNEILHKGNAISLMCGLFKALMYAHQQYINFCQRTHHLINSNTRQIGTNPAAKFRYDSRQKANLKSQQMRERTQKVNNVSTELSDHSEKMQIDEENKLIQDTKITSTNDLQRFGSKTQHAFDADKQEWKLEKDVELPFDTTNENGDEPRKKHARLHTGSESSDSPIDGNPLNEQADSIQVDDNADLDETKPLLSASDVSVSSSDDESSRPVRPSMVKVAPLLNNPANINISGKSASCYEEMDEEEEESDLDDSGSQNDECIFGPRAEVLFAEYMAERASEPDLALLEEDKLLLGLPMFRSIQPIYQMVIARNMSQQIFTNLKMHSIKAIENLCKYSEKNRLIAGRLDAIPLLLQFSIRQEGERGLVWPINALRTLCIECPENQDRLLDITERCSHFIDRQRLFLAMGVELADKGGKQILMPIEKD